MAGKGTLKEQLLAQIRVEPVSLADARAVAQELRKEVPHALYRELSRHLQDVRAAKSDPERIGKSELLCSILAYLSVWGVKHKAISAADREYLRAFTRADFSSVLESVKREELLLAESQKANRQPQEREQVWVSALHEQLSSLSELRSNVVRSLQTLSSEDLQLCLVWCNVRREDKRDVPSTWSQLLDSENSEPRNEALRAYSARSAERAAIDFFEEMGGHVVDVSIQQLQADSDAWKTHDIEVDTQLFDVKNARTSRASPDSYVEHTIPRFKRSRDQGAEIAILGVLSDYRSRFHIQDGDLGSATILGIVQDRELIALGSWMTKTFGDILDFAPIRAGRPNTYPGWIFEYPGHWYPVREEALRRIDEHLTGHPDIGKAQKHVPGYIFALLGKRIPAITDTNLEKTIAQGFEAVIREIGPSRRTLFGWILGTMLRLLESGSGRVREAGAAIRHLLFAPGLKSSSLYPAGLYDPKGYIKSLISMLEAVAEAVDLREAGPYKFFRLASPTILRGTLADGTEQTIYAHCGGCGKNPLHLGNSEICGSCGFLVCSECAFCNSQCLACAPRQRKHSQRHDINRD